MTTLNTEQLLRHEYIAQVLQKFENTVVFKTIVLYVNKWIRIHVKLDQIFWKLYVFKIKGTVMQIMW